MLMLWCVVLTMLIVHLNPPPNLISSCLVIENSPDFQHFSPKLEKPIFSKPEVSRIYEISIPEWGLLVYLNLNYKLVISCELDEIFEYIFCIVEYLKFRVCGKQ